VVYWRPIGLDRIHLITEMIQRGDEHHALPSSMSQVYLGFADLAGPLGRVFALLAAPLVLVFAVCTM